MNRIYAPNFGKRPTAGLRRLCCMLAVFFGIFQVTVGPAKADPITVNRVVQTLKTVQGTTDLHLSLITQDPLPSGTKTTATTGPGGGIGSNDPKLDALLSGFPIVPPSVNLGVDDISEEGEVDGTICDCGEILIAGGGFPKWPLLFLAAVPIAFIPDKDTETNPTPTPTPTPPSQPSPTPTPTPEPASLLIFGTGLIAVSAGLRRRYNRAKLASQIQRSEEQS